MSALFHRIFRILNLLIAFTGMVGMAFAAGCAAPQVTQGLILVSLTADGKQIQIDMAAGSTVQNALDQAGISLGSLDRVQPPVYTLLSDQSEVRIIRVREEFEIEETILPFESQKVYSESLPKDQKMPVQQGINGIQQNTYRRVYEDNVEVSRSLFKTETIREPQAEIWIIGRQSNFRSVTIPGRLVYLSNGNAWIMEDSTAIRRPLVTSGDLDGRIFTLSPNGDWLLFTRKSNKSPSEEINTLWVVSTAENPVEYDLNASNIVHYAEWVPDTQSTITYSTVEPRAAAPGWQANNNLVLLTFSPLSGALRKQEELLPANTGGVSGWWGASFDWSPDGEMLAYAQPDQIGLVEFGETTQMTPLLNIQYYNTHGDWAWVPGIAWAPDSSFLYITTHAPQSGLADQETSPLFNLTALGIKSSLTLELVQNSGMFAYPSPSPTSGSSFWIAYLQAIFPDQSDSSSYRLVLMDRDGSNRSEVFPLAGGRGLEPQNVTWSPDGVEQHGLAMAVLSQGDLWLVWADGSDPQQITGDGSIIKIDWK